MSVAALNVESLGSGDRATLAPRVRALLGAGRAAGELADYARKLTLTDVNRALWLADEVLAALPAGDWRGRCRTLAARAHALCYLNRVDEAIAVLADSESIAVAQDEPAERASAALALVQPLALAGRLAEAERCAAVAGESYAAAGDSLAAAKAGVNRAIVLRMQGRVREALQYFDAAREPLAGDPAHRAIVDTNRAEALLDLDEFAAAASAFGAAIDSFERGGNHHAAAIVEGNIAHLYGRQGRYNDAIRHFERARRRFETIGATADWARLDVEEAETLGAVGALSESYERCRTAGEQLDRLSLPREAAAARFCEALILIRMDQLAEAEGVLADVRGRYERLNIAPSVAQVDAAAAALLIRRGCGDAALPLLRQAVGALGDRPVTAALLRVRLASALRGRAALAEASAELDAAEAVLGPLELPTLDGELHAERARLLDAAGAREAAIAAWRAALDALERTRSALQTERLRAFWVAGGRATFEEAASAGLNLETRAGLEFAFDALERMRSRALLDLVCGAFSEEAGDPSERSDERALAAALAESQAALHAAYDRLGLGVGEVESLEEVGAARVRVAELERKTLALEARLAATARYAPVFARPATLADAQRGMSPDTAFIKYFLDGGRWSAILVSRERTETVRGLIGVEALTPLAERYGFQVERALARGPRAAAARTADLARAARPLFEALLAPLLPALRGVARLGLAPAGALHGLPLHALDAADGPLSAIDVTYCPSVSIARSIAERRPDAGCPLDLLAFGVADALAPAMVGEALRVAARAPRGRALVGDEASRDNLHAACRSARILHVASHAVLGAGDVGGSRLKLADGWLSAREIVGLRLSGSIVVLSGCETGRSSFECGEERFGLMRAFLAAGASAVLGSLWRLHDEVAPALFDALYAAHFSDRVSLSEALRRGQQTLLDQGIHPAFCKGLFLVGGLR